MSNKHAIIILASGLLIASIASAQTPQPSPGCDPGDRIDGSSTESAREKLNKAGFTQVTQLKKACDNFWHSRAMKDGKPVNVLLTPTGQAVIEGD
jgi:hypothetical protein